MKRRSFIAATGLSALSAGCLRLADSAEETTTGPPRTTTRETTPPNTETTTPPKAIPSGLSREWQLDGFTAFPRLRDESLYATGFGTTRRVATDGTTEWEFDTDEDYYGVGVTDSRVVVPTQSGTVYGLDREDGSAAWEASAPRGAECQSGPLVAGGVAIVLTSEPFGYLALDAQSGDRLWFDEELGPRTLNGRPPVAGTAAGNPERTYLRGTDAIHRVRPESGEVEASFEVFQGAPPRPRDDSLYVGARDGVLYSFDQTDATQEWQFETYDDIVSRPVVADGVVVVGSNDNSIYGVATSDGEQVWRHQTGDEVHGYPVLYKQTVYITSTDGKLYALDPQTGEKHLETEVGTTFYNIPVALNDRLHMVTDTKLEAYALEVTTGE